MSHDDRTPITHHASVVNPVNTDNRPVNIVETPGVKTSAHAVTPSKAFEAAAAKQPAIREALTAAGYTGEYTLSSAFNTPMFRHSSQLQEIHINIDVRRPSTALRSALARVLFPLPGVIHARGDKEYALPIIPPSGSKMEETEYWSLAVKEGIYKGEIGSNGRPHGAPPFQLRDIEEDEVKNGFWSCLKCW